MLGRDSATHEEHMSQRVFHHGFDGLELMCVARDVVLVWMPVACVAEGHGSLDAMSRRDVVTRAERFVESRVGDRPIGRDFPAAVWSILRRALIDGGGYCVA